MQLHLFSMPGEYPLRDIVAAGKPYLLAQPQPTVLYLPATGVTIKEEYVEMMCEAFKGLAQVEVLDLTIEVYPDFGAALERASLLCIPGGNTYLLLYRLYQSGLFGLIQQRVWQGLPLVGFSAGMLVCGANILTSNDINCCACTQFAGFGFVPYNFVAHYPGAEGPERDRVNQRIVEYYHAFHTNPVLALEDDGYIRVDGQRVELVRGHGWLFEKGRAGAFLNPGRGVMIESDGVRL